MNKLTQLIETKIRSILPQQFTIVFDEWTDTSTHYLAIFAVFPDKEQKFGYNRALLSFFPVNNVEPLNANLHHETIYDVLQQFGKNLKYFLHHWRKLRLESEPCKNVQRAKVDRPSCYIERGFLRLTSNMCERLFSLSKIPRRITAKRFCRKMLKCSFF